MKTRVVRGASAGRQGKETTFLAKAGATYTHCSLTCAQVVSSPPGPATRSSGPLSLYLTTMYACKQYNTVVCIERWLIQGGMMVHIRAHSWQLHQDTAQLQSYHRHGWQMLQRHRLDLSTSPTPGHLSLQCLRQQYHDLDTPTASLALGTRIACHSTLNHPPPQSTIPSTAHRAAGLGLLHAVPHSKPSLEDT
jgi:hypothetical protein